LYVYVLLTLPLFFYLGFPTYVAQQANAALLQQQQNQQQLQQQQANQQGKK